MKRVLQSLSIFILAAVFAGNVFSADGENPSTQAQLEQLSLPELEQHLSQIDDRLSSLSLFRLRSGIGSIGYRSDWRGTADRKEWVEFTLDREYPIDEIVLVPTLSRALKDYQSDGFPNAVRILMGTDENRTGAVVAQYGLNDHIQPRKGPLKIPVVGEPEGAETGVTASWVRIEATHLSKRAFDGKHVFQLSEVFLFSGSENVAIQQKVTSSSNANDHAGAWDMRYLVDGHTPYLMDSATANQSLAYVSRFGEQPILYLDLGAQYPISRIHLHAVDQNDTVPLAYAGNLGIPNRLKIEGATDKDFSDPTTLLDYERTNINDFGPIMMWNIPETSCQFVRVTAADLEQSELGLPDPESLEDIRIGFGEIELYSNGENVARGKRAFANYHPNPRDRSPTALTDGRNMFGEILSIRTWLDELAQRQVLESQRPMVNIELNRRYSRQTEYLTWVTWLAALLAFAIGAMFLINRMIRTRQLLQLRTRFAADLHDELGADLHVIGLLSDLAHDSVDSSEKHKSLHRRIRTMTQRSSDAVRYCTNMLEAKGLYGDLLEDMQRSTERIMPDFDGGFTFQDDSQILSSLKPRARADLFLFYKETLVNISRHSSATHFSANLSADSDGICLEVCDDGAGLTDVQMNCVPPSLRRRARLLGANVSVRQPESGGTCITLNIKPRKWGVRRW